MDSAQFNLANPWRAGKPWEVPSIPRQVLPEILDWIHEPEILVLLGARQVGKTSLVYQVIDSLLGRSGIDAQDIFFFNLDLAGFSDFFTDQSALLRFLDSSRQGRGFVFVDEVQRFQDPGRFFKAMQDLRLPLKFILTGSSSLDIRMKTAESLTGRKRVFRITPLTFSEYLGAVGCAVPLDRLEEDSIAHHINELNEHLDRYAQFGGYPAVVLTENRDRKILRLEEIFTSYLEKDITGILKIGNLPAFKKLTALISSQQGSLVNVQELSGTLGIHRNTVDNYLHFLEETFVTVRIAPFFLNSRTELSKMPKIYFLDPGLRNHALGGIGGAASADAGALMEGMVGSALSTWHRISGSVHFWRSTSKAEVDFVVADTRPEISIEVKSGKLDRVKVTRGYRSFLEKYAPGRALLLNRNLWSKERIGECEVEAVPTSVFLAGKVV